MIKRDRWKWFGYAGHLIVSDSCRFHLWTKVGKFIISTVGDYRPTKDGGMETIGADKDSFFETYVFRFGKYDDCGCPMPRSWEEIDGIRTPNHTKATKAHIDFCLKYARKI